MHGGWPRGARHLAAAMTTALLLLSVATALAQSDDAPPDVPLWPGATATVRARDEAVLRGVEFVYALGMGRDDANFFAYGHDFLLCLHGVAHRAVGPVVRQRALDVAKALGRKWKREHTEVHEDATTAHAQRLLFGTFALDRLGMHFATLKAELREFLAAHDSHDFLGWHPAQRGPDEEAPPAPPPRRTRRTRKDGGGELVESAAIDGAAANASSPLRRWAGALVRTYVADKLQLPLGGLTSPAATYADALRWRPTFLPYGAGGAAAREQAAAVSALLQTLSDFGRLQLPVAPLRAELDYVRSNLTAALASASGDVDVVGELLDAARAFGRSEEGGHEEVRAGVGFLLRTQQLDGSWPAATKGGGGQAAYHPTCAAMLGLAPHEHHGFGPAMPSVLPTLRRQAGLEEEKDEL